MIKPGDDRLICSRRGCVRQATWALCWKNPLVRGQREKVWLSCDEHQPYFEQYFSYRRFPYRWLKQDQFSQLP